jgi:hypothetical protein
MRSLRSWIWILFLCSCLFLGILTGREWANGIHTKNHQELRADLVELIIASDPTLSNEEIKHKVNDLYKFIVENE